MRDALMEEIYTLEFTARWLPDGPYREVQRRIAELQRQVEEIDDFDRTRRITQLHAEMDAKAKARRERERVAVLNYECLDYRDARETRRDKQEDKDYELYKEQQRPFDGL